MMGSFSAIPTHAKKEEIDSRSIYVGNVDYGCTANELERHFQQCGTVNRVTIMTDIYGHPKGFAYVEFVDASATQNAILLNKSLLRNRLLKISQKRTNIPGLKTYRGSWPYNSYFRFPAHRRGGPIRHPPGPPPFFNPPYGYGKAPTHRYPPKCYRPY